ncbi:DUF4747 family protein [Phaeobacter inhibens]|uniref:DUF4747 family protein n=1 Tax=Phaeobacter inhibens TaxID=221822 RepID=UPI000CA1D1E0|nr:DUF4747 family protein [Phaeobacter inhibens]AUR08474.1 hypothetical protein PhaeoP59_02312 [Phaeobacter inhibens]AUR12308.1 hypothetical protein PhaeoP48_02331 [Phaeobacter inhibens]
MPIREYVLLNVVAHPHPEGIYRRLFELAAAGSPVKYRGDRYARISPITATKDGVFRGRLATWSEIDPNSPAVNKNSLEEKTLEESGIRLPGDIGFNSRIFYFAFREEGHGLYVELKNDEGRTITPSIARSAFHAILSAVAEGLTDEFMVHIASRNDAIGHVLGLTTIRKIEIDLHIPNPDDLSQDHQMVLDEINEMNAKRLQTSVVRAGGENTLLLTRRYRVMAELAADNGEVSVDGVKPDGSKARLSTRDFPARIKEEIAEGDSSYGVIGRIAGEGREMNLFRDDFGEDFDVLE